MSNTYEDCKFQHNEMSTISTTEHLSDVIKGCAKNGQDIQVLHSYRDNGVLVFPMAEIIADYGVVNGIRCQYTIIDDVFVILTRDIPSVYNANLRPKLHEDNSYAAQYFNQYVETNELKQIPYGRAVANFHNIRQKEQELINLLARRATIEQEIEELHIGGIIEGTDRFSMHCVIDNYVWFYDTNGFIIKVLIDHNRGYDGDNAMSLIIMKDGHPYADVSFGRSIEKIANHIARGNYQKLLTLIEKVI